MGGPTSSYATAGIAVRVCGTHKPPQHYKVEYHQEGLVDMNNFTNVQYLTL
jgi:hypothetical protein